jgi:hypothetical protein
VRRAAAGSSAGVGDRCCAAKFCCEDPNIYFFPVISNQPLTFVLNPLPLPPPLLRKCNSNSNGDALCFASVIIAGIYRNNLKHANKIAV